MNSTPSLDSRARHTIPGNPGYLTGFVALFVLSALVAASRPLAAQSEDTAVATVNTPVFLGPDASHTPLRLAAAGTSFVVFEASGEWTKVQFQDPQWGRRVGFVATKDLRFHRQDLQPMDLSVKPEGSAPIATPGSAPVTSTAPRRMVWPGAYVIGRTGVTFGTRTAPLVGVEVGGQVAPVAQVYGAFDWHRDISPKFVQDVSEIVSALVGADVNYRFPAYTLMAGVKVTSPSGALRPYGLGGFGYGRVNGTVEIGGEDVTGLLDSLGYLNKDDVRFNKALFEVGGGLQAAHGPLFIDISYRFRKFLGTDVGINMSGLYAGAGVGF